MSEAIQVALVAGGFGVVGAVLTWLFGQLSIKQNIQRERDERLVEQGERERAVLHGSFSLCNFIGERLNDWLNNRAFWRLEELAVAQNYLAKLIERSPHQSETLMVSIIDLGLRLDSLLFVIGQIDRTKPSMRLDEIDDVDRSVNELFSSVEVLMLILDGDPAMMTEEEIAAIVSNPEDVLGRGEEAK